VWRDISCVVDHHIERAVAPADGIGHALELIVTADVEQTIFRLRSGLPDIGGGLPQASSSMWPTRNNVTPSRAKASATFFCQSRLAPVMSATLPLSFIAMNGLLTSR
jgi:hypothetical protein